MRISPTHFCVRGTHGGRRLSSALGESVRQVCDKPMHFPRNPAWRVSIDESLCRPRAQPAGSVACPYV